MSENDRAKPAYVAHREEVAETIIRMLEEGVAPWQQEWASLSPFNPITAMSTAASTGRYNGGNAIYLMAMGIMRGYRDPRWVTFNQASKMKAGTMNPLTEKELAHNAALPFGDPDRVPTWHVRKGEHGVRVEKWGRAKPKAAATLEDDAKPARTRLFMKPYTVFNAAQIAGIPDYEPLAMAWTPDERCAMAEETLRASGAKIVHGGDEACYIPLLDRIQLPIKEAFPTPESYYATAHHELAHWTGHGTRLAREGITGNAPYGSALYAKEELRAEIASMMISQETGLPHDVTRHAAYVGHWVKALRSDPNEIYRAAADASKITDFVLAFRLGLTLEPSDIADDALEMTAEPAVASVAAGFRL